MKKQKVLVVEDEISLLDLLKDVLEETGLEVITAVDGEMGMQKAIKELPDLILLDIVMPKKDGFEVLGELKMQKETQNIPVILLTNLSQPQDIQRAIELGANTYLVKSEYQLSDVVKKIKEMLRIS